MLLEFWGARWWWPWSTTFLGACVVEGRGVDAAADRAWELGCNPGGTVYGFEVPARVSVGPHWRDRLLARAEYDRMCLETGAPGSRVTSPLRAVVGSQEE